MKIKIPDSYEPEWQAKMLREVANRINKLDAEGRVNSGGQRLMDETKAIIEALREYSGY
ncbi:hypothetical protein [Pectobacterium parmentieri]|uniref:hypothetical protein n=1 Tax=Pectobacterium parmentieri TaxID=1905730 RepID=UPI00160069AE|nr:hypothetical protein [Pectobacterium parmentieri]